MKQFKKYAHNRFNLLLDKLEKYAYTTEQEMLHHIRIELKKIKTLFHLINFCSKKFNAAKEYNPLKEIFREAGKIREVYLTDKLFLEYRIKFVKDTNINKEYGLISEFVKNILHYKKIVSKNYKKMEKYFEKVDINCLKKYLNIKEHEVKVKIYPDQDESKLHEARKIIKEIIYLSSISPWSKKNLNPLYDEIQNAVGRWHDKQMLIKLLEEHYFDSHNPNIEKLKSKCRIDVKNLKSMISNLYKKEPKIILITDQDISIKKIS